MVRHATLTIGLLALAASLPVATSARAQFDTIFGNGPPRPPADVPNSPQPQQPGYYPSQPYPQQRPNARDYPAFPQQGTHPDYRDYPAAQRQPQVPAVSRDEPPAQPMPAPMSLPPSARPGGGTIESQPLAPPPGTAPAQQATKPSPANPASVAKPASPPQPGATQQAIQPPAGQGPGTPPQPPAMTDKPPTNEVVMQPPPQRISNPTAVFEGLDKITGRITSFDVAINETVQFGALQVTPKACYSRPPTETPQTDAFVDVDEVTLKGNIKRIFTGWMFKASPGLHAVEHPIYDVWLIDCNGGKNPDVADASDGVGGDQAPAAPAPNAKPAKPAAQRAVPRRATRARPSAQSRGFLPAIR